jgi:hypothetical protein
MDQQNTPPAQIPDDIRQYLTGLITEAKIPSLDEAGKESLIQELFLSLDDYLATVILDNLPPEQLDEFINLNEQGKPKEEVEAFLQKNLPNAQDVFGQAFVAFRQNYLGAASA